MVGSGRRLVSPEARFFNLNTDRRHQALVPFAGQQFDTLNRRNGSFSTFLGDLAEAWLVSWVPWIAVLLNNASQK